MYHSNLNGFEYEDATCIMGGAGYFIQNDEQGEMCFNAPKSHYLRWFSQYHNDFTPTTTGYSGELVPTNDVAAGSISTDQHYILKLSGTGETDLYVHYNKSEGITADMDYRYRSAYGNAVMVYSQASRTATSAVLAGLTAPGQTYAKANWAGSSHSLKIEVCSITAGSSGTAKVIVYVDGVTTASCSATTPATTAAPAAAITSSPTAAPAAAITSSPTAAPAVVITSSSTVAPAAAITSSPTVAPAAAITSSPTAAPAAAITSSPTAAPAAAITSSPTAAPAAAITSSPIAAPAAAITSSPTAAPVATGEKCQDTPKKFFYNNGKSKSCKFVAKRNTERRCSNTSASANCPVTCETVCECYDTVGSYKMKKGGARKNWCKWAVNKNTVKRCDRNRVRANCPVACGVC